MDRQTEKKMSQGQEVKEMFHARFDACFFDLVVDQNTNFDVNVEFRHKC